MINSIATLVNDKSKMKELWSSNYFYMITKLKNVILASTLFLIPTIIVAQTPPPLGVSEQFVLFTSIGALEESGVSSIVGDVGSNIGLVTVCGGCIIGTLHSPSNSTTAQCAIDVTAAWDNINAQPAGTLLGAQLGNGQVLSPAIYLLAGASTAIGTLTLDGGGNPDACFIFKMDGAFSAAASTTIILTNGTKACNVFWRVEGAVDLATGSIWKGTMIIGGASTVGTMCNIEGRFLHVTGAISVESLTITKTTSLFYLPIELLSFTARAKDEHVQLNWVTASETNNDDFTVERSIDGINFETIAIVDGAGNSSQILNYSAVDNAPLNGISHYRLKQTDYDGQFDYSNLVAVEFKNRNDFIFNIYPNPNDGQSFNLKIPKNIAEVLVVVYDMLGKEIYSKVIITRINGNDVYAIDPSQKLNSGVYLIIASSSFKIYNERLIIK